MENKTKDIKRNNFQDDLELSLTTKADDLFEKAYKELFGDELVSIEKITYEDNKELQIAGVDKILHLKNGRTVNVDEKWRRKQWGDIALELLSNENTGRLGWFVKSDNKTELIAYAFEPTQRVILFNLDEAKEAYLQNAHTWIPNYHAQENGFSKVTAYNKRNGKTFKSISMGIRINLLKTYLTKWRDYTFVGKNDTMINDSLRAKEIK